MVKILHSKRVVPSVSDTIRRERLLPIQAEIPGYKVTTVVAGAGFGKTTLVAQTVKDKESVWYALDRTDSDLTTFLGYLIAGIQNTYSAFGRETLRFIEFHQQSTQSRNEILTVLASELEHTVEKDLAIVLDDYHYIQDSQEINSAIEFLISHLPPLVHLIIISRNEPPLRLSRLRSNRDLLEVKTWDLVFTCPEIEQLYSEVFDITLPAKRLKALRKKTEGWISGLILFFHFLKRKKPDEIDRCIMELKGSHDIISSYLEENVYDGLSSELKDFLAKTSMLARLNTGFCNGFLGIANASGILNELAKRHLFTHALDEEKEWFGYHHLFRDFLKKKLRHEHSATVVKNLHLKAADLLDREKSYDEAIHHYILAEDFGRACKLLKKTGNSLLEKGRIRLVRECISLIPVEFLSGEAWFLHLNSHLQEISGQLVEAASGYQNAYESFRKAKSRKNADICLLGLGRIHFLTGNAKESEVRLKELLAGKNLETDIRIEALGYLAIVASHQGRIEQADSYIDLTMRLLSKVESPRKLGIGLLYLSQSERYFNSGDFHEALLFGEKAKNVFADVPVYRSLIVSCYYISMSYFNRADFTKGLEAAEYGLKLAEDKGFQTDLFYGNLLICAAHNLVGQEKTEEAIYQAEAGLAFFLKRDFPLGQARAYSELHLAWFNSGNISKATEHARIGLNMAKDLDMPRLICVLKIQLAQALLVAGQLDEALTYIKEAEDTIGTSKSLNCTISLLYALYFWSRKQKKAALDKMLDSLAISKSIHYEFRIVFYKRQIVPLLIELHAQGKMTDYIRRIVTLMGPYARNILMAAKNHGSGKIKNSVSELLNLFQKDPIPGLNVQFFGKFRIIVKSREITTQHWRSKKAEMLFKYLLYHRSHGYKNKEVCLELLWPEGDPKKTEKRFHVALAAIRKVLEPRLGRGSSSSYILRKGNSYNLQIGENGQLDTEIFLNELQLAQNEKNPEIALQRYLKAESMVKGDFLLEDLYVDWCAEEREKLNHKYLFALRKIIEHHENKKDYTACIDYAVKYLQNERFDETMYQRLMRYYSYCGNKAMIKKTFEKCKDILIADLDCPVSKETETVYRQLLSN